MSQFAAGRYQNAVQIYSKLYADHRDPVYLRNIGRCQSRQFVHLLQWCCFLFVQQCLSATCRRRRRLQRYRWSPVSLPCHLCEWSVPATADRHDLRGVGWDSTSGVYTGTCLGPGETGYLLGRSASGNYASITGVLPRLSAAGTTFGLPKALVIPRIYDFDIKGNSWEIEVMNVGSASADLTKGSHRAVYFASDGLPLTWGFLDVIANPVLAPSRTGILGPAKGNDVGAGSSSQQHVIVDYSGASAATP